jgi:hypothetical protein
MTNFQYENEFASDYQLMVCSFDSVGLETETSGSELSTEQIKVVGTDEFVIINNDYSSALTFVFQTCKRSNNCQNPAPEEITAEEFSKINRWVNRKESHKFKIDKSGYEGIYFFGRFNTQAIKINNIIYGVEFTFTSDYPYGFMDEIVQEFTGKDFMIYDHSDEIGDLYPYCTITCNETGNLTLTNTMDNEIFSLNNCKKGEVISIDNKNSVITSSDLNHKLYDDFNFNYIKVCNTYEERRNFFSSSLDINMEIKYSPIRKVGI